MATARASRRNRSRYDESFTRFVRQHLDRDTTPHHLVFGQVDAAHAALADLAEQLVLAQAEALVLPGEQLIGLPPRDEVFRDQQLGEAILVLERGLAVGRRGFLKKRRELGLVDEVASSNRSTNLLVVTLVIAP